MQYKHPSTFISHKQNLLFPPTRNSISDVWITAYVLSIHYGNMGRRVSKGEVQNYCILFTDVAASCQKLGIILENKVI